MKSTNNNKQNTVPNKKNSIFSNPFICAKMFNNPKQSQAAREVQQQNINNININIGLKVKDQQKLNKQSRDITEGLSKGIQDADDQIRKQKQVIQFQPYNVQDSGNSYQITKSEKQINTYISTQSNTSLSKQELVCQKHLTKFTNLFCTECLSYNLCIKCIQDADSEHRTHRIVQYPCHNELLTQTKQIILQNLEQTLKQLKSKENQVKNRAHQVNLIKNSLRVLEQQVVAVISGYFKDIQANLITSLQRQQQYFNKQIQKFFAQFNQINDQLRENLMSILDGQINFKQFHKAMVVKQPPSNPNFMQYKNTMEKYKKVFKCIKTQFTSIKANIDQAINSIGKQGCEKNKSSTKMQNSMNTNMNKFDKYIENITQKNEKVNYSFLKTLKLIEMPGQMRKRGNNNINTIENKSLPIRNKDTRIF